MVGLGLHSEDNLLIFADALDIGCERKATTMD